MFFYLAKIAWFVLQPSALCIFLILIGIIGLRKRPRKRARQLIIFSTIMLLAIAFSPLGRQVMIPLEDRFPLQRVDEMKEDKIDGIIVLGGTVHMIVTDQRDVPSIVSGAERIFEAVKMARKYPEARIILAGGPNTFMDSPTADSVVVKRLMISMGIERHRFEIERRSKNTFQNAVMAKEIAKPKPGETWYLITSAYHMPRAIGCFRKAGWDVKAHPVDYYTGGEVSRYKPFYYALDGVTITDTASKEWLGLLAYWFTERSNSLFPGPASKSIQPTS